MSHGRLRDPRIRLGQGLGGRQQACAEYPKPGEVFHGPQFPVLWPMNH